jgi:hypothetical protein
LRPVLRPLHRPCRVLEARRRVSGREVEMKATLVYLHRVVTAVAIWRENRNPTRRVAPDRRFFCRRSNINGGLRGATERLAGVLVGQFSHPVSVRHSRREKRSGGFRTTRSPSHA